MFIRPAAKLEAKNKPKEGDVAVVKTAKELKEEYQQLPSAAYDAMLSYEQKVYIADSDTRSRMAAEAFLKSLHSGIAYEQLRVSTRKEIENLRAEKDALKRANKELADEMDEMSGHVQPRNHEEEEEENSMTSKISDAVISATTAINNEGREAIWRTAAVQAVKTVKGPLLAYLKTQKLEKGTIGHISKLLGTSIGEGTLAFALGAVLSSLPTGDVKVRRLASELRLLGMTAWGVIITDAVMGPLQAVLTTVVMSLPADKPITVREEKDEVSHVRN